MGRQQNQYDAQCDISERHPEQDYAKQSFHWDANLPYFLSFRNLTEKKLCRTQVLVEAPGAADNSARGNFTKQAVIALWILYHSYKFTTLFGGFYNYLLNGQMRFGSSVWTDEHNVGVQGFARGYYFDSVMRRH